MNSNAINGGPGLGASPLARQNRANQEGTPTDKPVSLDKPAKLEQNTLMGKFSGHKSEAK